MNERSRACETNWDRANALLDDRLDPRTNTAIQEHLRACAPCRDELDHLSSVLLHLNATSSRSEPVAIAPRRKNSRLVFRARAIAIGLLTSGFLLLAFSRTTREGPNPPVEPPHEVANHSPSGPTRSRILNVRPIERIEYVRQRPVPRGLHPKPETRLISLIHTNTREIH